MQGQKQKLESRNSSAKLTFFSANWSKRYFTDSLDDCCVDKALLIRGLTEVLPSKSPWKDNTMHDISKFTNTNIQAENACFTNDEQIYYQIFFP